MYYVAGTAKVARAKHWLFWAERGLIHAENTVDGHYQVFSVEQANERVKALEQRVKHARQLCAENRYYADQVRPEERFLEELKEIIKLAVDQGTPSNPDAPAEYARRRPVTILMPSSADVSNLTRFRNTSE